MDIISRDKQINNTRHILLLSLLYINNKLNTFEKTEIDIQYENIENEDAVQYAPNQRNV